jgi:hypothetical protein
LDDLVIGAFGADPSKPSPLTSPAEETDLLIKSKAFSPLITKPPVPDSMGLSDLIVGAYGADVTGYKTNEGKSYVVFGKNNTNAVDLSRIAAGTGGFVINGESNEDLSGESVSSAGDVNGDGLDDLVSFLLVLVSP